uniref:Uncharacterized protein n=1 Tax=Salix viminalis TaxID=40686 RepID=A0A6N2M4H0_SALVM
MEKISQAEDSDEDRASFPPRMLLVPGHSCIQVDFAIGTYLLTYMESSRNPVVKFSNQRKQLLENRYPGSLHSFLEDPVPSPYVLKLDDKDPHRMQEIGNFPCEILTCLPSTIPEAEAELKLCQERSKCGSYYIYLRCSRSSFQAAHK